MDEAQERQKFISSAQHVREMPNKMDSQHETSANECSGSEQKSAIKSSGNKRGFKFPILDKISVKQKLKPNISFKKVEKDVLDPNKVTADCYLEDKYMVLKEREEEESLKILQHQAALPRDTRRKPACHLVVIGMEPQWYSTKHTEHLRTPQDYAGPSSETALENWEKSPGRKSSTESSKLSLDRRGLERKNKIGSVAAQAQAQPSTSTAQEAGGSSAANRLSGLSLLRHRRASFRSRGKNSCSVQHLSTKDSHKEVEETKDADWLEKESLHLNVNHLPSTLSPSHSSSEISLAQSEHSVEEGINDKTVSSRQGKPSRWHLKKKKLTGKATEPQQRKSRGIDKLYPPAGNYTDTAGPSESESRAANSFLPKTSSALPVPLPHSTLNSQGSLTQSAQRSESSTNRSSTTVSPQAPDLDGSSKFTVHAPLCLLHHRDSLSPAGNFEFSMSLHCIPENNSFPEDSSNASSPSGASPNGASLQNSHSSLSLDSPGPSGFQARFIPNPPAASALYDQLPFALLAVYALQNLNSSMSNTTVSQAVSSEEVKKPPADQEKLKQLQESLLAEDSGEEGDRCRICQIAGGSPTNPLLEPCGCVGSLQFVHEKCLKKWLETKIKSGADLGTVKTCELCKQRLKLDLDDFNVNEYYRNHHYSEAENELTDLYLVLLFHVWDLMRQNYNLTSRNRRSRQPRAEENENSDSDRNR